MQYRIICHGERLILDVVNYPYDQNDNLALLQLSWLLTIILAPMLYRFTATRGGSFPVR
ncbi:hypothetical protein [Erwinia endophytica]|uniref:hypothetical protein n=1 Tax=Erwinia endophytica TaxID=1563158 RepID=UPI00186B615B|nr:hypothetical protein [Erwinia endophytica]